MDVFKVDVTGQDIFTRNYAIIVLVNDKHAYAYKFPNELQRKIWGYFRAGVYGVDCKIKPRTYTVVLYLILKNIAKEVYISDSEFSFQICPDMDGNQGYIIELLKTLSFDLFKEFTSDNYTFTKHNKKSKIQQLAEQVSRDDWTAVNKVNINEDDLHNLLAKKKYRKNCW